MELKIKNKMPLYILTAAVIALIIEFGGFGGLSAKEKPSSAAKMVSHKALYEMKLEGLKSGTTIAGLTGDMFFKLEDSCDAWSVNQLFKIRYDYINKAPLTTLSNYVSLEKQDGTDFQYISKSDANGMRVEQLRGHASRNKTQGKGVATYTRPEGLAHALPKGFYLPMAHTIELIKHAKQGDRFFSATIFDGTDTDGPIEVNAFIGKKVEAVKGKAFAKDIDKSLLGGMAWHMRLAFFSLKIEDGLPKYEMTFVLHENGIITDLLVEYKDFSVKQNLKALERLTEPNC